MSAIGKVGVIGERESYRLVSNGGWCRMEVGVEWRLVSQYEGWCRRMMVVVEGKEGVADRYRRKAS